MAIDVVDATVERGGAIFMIRVAISSLSRSDENLEMVNRHKPIGFDFVARNRIYKLGSLHTAA